jgi:predicted nucleic-acid-binding Zn-ribbon protein
MSKEGRTFSAHYRVRGRRGWQTIILRRILTLPGIAFTVLDCAKCKWRVHLEAHHVYGTGKRRKITAAQKKRGYAPPKWDKRCPKCRSREWHYVRTDVHDHGPSSSLYSALAGEKNFPATRRR